MRGKNRFNDKYRLSIAGDWCVYCGELATQRDHFPPAICEQWGYLLPVCRECNQLAGTWWPYDFELRTGVVKAKLRSRGQRLLETPDWSKDEIAELTGNTRREVQRWQKRKEKLVKRLAWPALEYLYSIDQASVFVPNPVASYFITESDERNFPSSDDSATKRRITKRLNSAVARRRQHGERP